MPTLLSQHHLVFSKLLSRYKLQLILTGGCLGVGAILLGLDVPGAEAIMIWASFIAIVFGLPWLVLALMVYARSVKKISIHEEGIGWIHRGGEEFHPWDEVREVYRSETVTTPWQKQSEMTLVFKKKEQLRVNECMSDFFQLATLVEAAVTERLLPQCRQGLDEGGALFGPILLQRQGIRINNRDFAWEQVEEYAIANGGLVVTPFDYEDFSGEFADFREVPNYLVLLRLLEELGKLPVPATQCILLTGRKLAGGEHDAQPSA